MYVLSFTQDPKRRIKNSCCITEYVCFTRINFYKYLGRFVRVMIKAFDYKKALQFLIPYASTHFTKKSRVKTKNAGKTSEILEG